MLASACAAPSQTAVDDGPVAPVAGVLDSAREVPALPREARGVWIATVANIDWPSKGGLHADSQKAELRRIFDRVRALRMNLVILQVRPAGDALYPSRLEPWSEYLTGEMGKPPEPYYDPLAFAIEEAHARGLELHAWFNPYRAGHPSARSAPAAAHISQAHPQLVRKYGSQRWMDPGEPAVQQHSLNVIMDVLNRYDVDGIHIDDYFYPYRENDSTGKVIDFPDEPSWNRYLAAGGQLSRNDWRRSNVDQFVQRLHTSIHAAKPHVKFGISPFGIWRPGYPPLVRGLDAYVELFADSRKWLNEGWLDYWAPQLYWKIAAPEQSYPQLLEWWVEENRMQRHIWVGNAAYRIQFDQQKWTADEIISQIVITREQRGASGNIHFSLASLTRNRGGISDALSASLYSYDALMPPTPWLDDEPPPSPQIRVLADRTLEITAGVGEPAFLYTVVMRSEGIWLAIVLPATQNRYLLPPGVDRVGVTAVDRNGNESPAMKVVLTSSRS